MQRVSRIKLFIFAAIACAILFCIAAFSVSWARWDGVGEGVSVEAKGEASDFYVEYPQYVTSGGIAIPALEANKYYLQVQKANGVSDYYRMKDNSGNTAEKMITNVYIKANTVLDMYKGTTKESIKIRNSSSAAEFEHAGSDDNEVETTAKVTKTGYYDFYYDFGGRKMYASYKAGASGNGNTGNTTTVAPNRDTNKESVKIKFTDSTVVFKLDSGLGDTTYFHIWKEGGQGTKWPGLVMNKDASDTWAVLNSDMTSCNSIEFNYPVSEVTGIILNNNNIQTGDGTAFFGAMFSDGLQANYTYTIKPTVVHWNDLTGAKDWNGEKLSGYFNITATKPQTSSGGSSTVTTVITAAKPTTTGATSFTVGEQKPNTKVETVRVMNTVNTAVREKTVDGKTTYEYSNYICVSRPNADDAADDNSLAIIEFEIEGANLSNVLVSSITLKRRDTDSDGIPLSSYVETSPRIYNYDPTESVTLDKIGHGDLHEEFDDVDAQGKDTAHMIKHYDDGMYVVIYFADNKQQYFALDMIIETETAADFTLTAKINNTNMWDRYETGFGEEWGYYLGGLINEVWLWHPTRTTKFTTDEGAVKFDFVKEGKALGILSDGAGVADVTPEKWCSLYTRSGGIGNAINDFNSKPATEINYYIADFSAGGTKLDEDGYPMWARYTKEHVDISLTINLTEGSKVKLSMLDWSGQRGDIGNNLMRPTTYYLPNTIHALPDNLFAGADNYDKDLNFVIPKTGEYSFRFVGYIHNYVGYWMKKSNGELYLGADGKPTQNKPANSDQYVQMSEYNFVIDELYISCATVVGQMFTVTFDAGEGSFDADTVTEQKVRFGNMISWAEGKAPQLSQINAPADKEFGGWYYLRTNSNGTQTAVDYDEGDPVRGDMTLYVKWKGLAYNVTFEGNGGKWGTDETKTVATGNDGKIASADLPAKPERTGWAFACWQYKNDATKTITHEALAGTVFTATTTLVAQWKQLFTVTYYYNYTGNSSAYKTVTGVVDGSKITAPDAPTRTGYTFSKWYKEAGCTNEWNFSTDTVTANTSLYADWTIDKYKVTINTANANLPSGVTLTTEYEVEYNNKLVLDDVIGLPDATHSRVSLYTNSSFTTAFNAQTTPITGDTTLHARFECDNGIYANGVYKGALTTNYESYGTTNLRVKAEDVNLIANDKLTFWWNKQQVKTNVKIRANCSGENEITGTSYTNITVKTSGYYSLYYDAGNSGQEGIWVEYLFKADKGDGVYNSDGTLLKAFAKHTDENDPYQVKAENFAVTADNTTVTVKYSGYTTVAKVKSGCTIGTTVTGVGIKLNKGVYTFYYNYSTRNTWIANGEGFVVEFNLNGGKWSDSTTTNKVVVANNTIPTADRPGDPSRDGYTFAGWYDTQNASGGTRYYATSTFSANKTLYARWAQNYTINYTNLPTGATNDLRNPSTYTTLDNTKTIYAPTMPSDKKFLGWKKTDASGTVVEQITATNVASLASGSTITLYADWDYQYVVTFYYNYTGAPNGGVVDTRTVQKGYTIDDMPSIPTRTGYTSDGKWYKEADCLNEWTSSDTVSKATSLYIKWTVNVNPTYTVTFDVNTANGGSGSSTSTEMQTGDQIVKPATDPTPSNNLYDFDGWYTSATGGDKVTTFPKVGTSDVTYYAHYVAARYRIVINTSNWTTTNCADSSISSADVYHIHAWGGTGVGTVTGTTGNEWNTRPQMTSIGNNKYSFDLDNTGITNFIVTRDTSTSNKNAKSRFASPVSSLVRGQVYEFSYPASIANTSIGLMFNDGYIILDASNWSNTNDRPTNIHMWKSDNTNLNGEWPGGSITYGKFKHYDWNMADIYGIILGKNSGNWTDDIKPGIGSYDSLENGCTYTIKWQYFKKKTS